MPEEPVSEELALSLARMLRQLFTENSPESTLDRITSYATSVVDKCDEASVLLVQHGRRLETMASTSELGRESDRLQTELGEGPCFDAIEQQWTFHHIRDMSREDRWPRYAPRAHDLGIGSAMGFLLFTEQGTLGALNLYSARPDAFTQSSERVGWLVASQAAVAFASALNDAQLHEALDTRQDIGAAVGIAMERYKLPRDQAFNALVKVSQHRNVKLREIAQQVVETGEIG